jgi:hypothetical protein
MLITKPLFSFVFSPRVHRRTRHQYIRRNRLSVPFKSAGLCGDVHVWLVGGVQAPGYTQKYCAKAREMDEHETSSGPASEFFVKARCQ